MYLSQIDEIRSGASGLENQALQFREEPHLAIVQLSAPTDL
jgi:hypothetical protein